MRNGVSTCLSHNMIVHAIEPYPLHTRSVYATTGRKKFKGAAAGSPEHLASVFERALRQNKYEIGEVVLYRRKPAQIINIYEEIHEVEWDGFRARFIELWCDADERTTFLVHHSEIKRKK